MVKKSTRNLKEAATGRINSNNQQRRQMASRLSYRWLPPPHPLKKTWGAKGTNMNEIYSKLGWSLRAVYFAPLLLPSPVKIFEAPATLPLSFVAAPKINPHAPPKN